MKIGALTILKKCEGNRWLIAAWHSSKSVTWSWLLAWHPRSPNTKRGWYRLDAGKGRSFMGLNSMVVGDFHFQRQPPIPKDKPAQGTHREPT